MSYRDDEFKEVTDADVVHVDLDQDEEKKHEDEKYCYICHRPKSVVGELINIPGNIAVCRSCMQRTFDTMKNGGFPMNGFPGMFGGFGGFDNTDAKKGNENTSDKDGDKSKGKGKGNGIPNIPVINLGDIASMMNPAMRQTAKKAPKKKHKVDPVIDIDSIPAPHKIKAALDEFVVGQEKAKKVMSVAVYNHYKRVIEEKERDENAEKDENGDIFIDPNEIEIEKSNILLLGPTGSGKTYLVKTLARLLDVPLAITDATSLTEAGYIGDDIESVVSKLLAAADNDVESAERGIIFIDEIDKIAKKKNAHHRDVSGESVQQGMLKLLEGSEVEVPVGASSKNAMVPMATVDTRNILFICGGAFPDLSDIIKERLNKNSSIGFGADLKDKYDGDDTILDKVTVEDLRKYGMIPEFLGRLPIICALRPLDEDMLVKILVEPKNAIVKQYKKLLMYDEVDLQFEEDALRLIASKAREKEVGARALRSVIEEYMMDIMYEIPKDENIGRVTITKEFLEGCGGPRIEMRSVAPKLAAAGAGGM
ncbi:MAG: ATP-dependent Clp protease ATP-binding subunit ClpX [Lachnospiraceae bacterium]|nr:ATP-dependent Clp protease ATP-binding subunit ClpX [Lachnospiraceae bacterium]